MKREVRRYLGFAWAIINCLCAGSITCYSVYAPLFQRRLHYTQLRVNAISITAELAMYLPVPIFGYLCDRYGPGVPSLLSGSLFGAGYILAAFTYKSGPPALDITREAHGWPFGIMVLAYVGIGMGTSCMYLSAVTTCAKNFGRGKHKGLALALPIAAFGLSGMWISQVGERLLYETRSDGSRGEVDVFRFFVFLGCTLLATGIIGTFTLRIVGEDEMIDEAVEELEQSGLLEESAFFRHESHGHVYAATEDRDSDNDSTKSRLEEEQRKKTWLLNEETRLFLSDKNMWLLAAGFFLVTGPGEAFINNLGTIIGTLYPSTLPVDQIPTSAATHVSIVAIMSTVARILTGTLSDLFAPTYTPHQHRRGPNSLVSSMATLPGADSLESGKKGFEVSRIVFLLLFSLIMSVGQVVLASGAIQGHGEHFWIVSAAIGAGYGAVFSLTPIIVSIVWGVENFGTNWACIATVPAAGATLWGLLYSAVYQKAAEASGADLPDSGDNLCYGRACYSSTFWAMAISVWVATILWLWAWRGPNGWYKRGIVV
ncbi:major facilitator superfamily domain-containing protein [Delphinella strobiligena]|nr:major facilitator superfamily domain-containing protein [Delphinella strobiligena]